jgi:VanZ family protein
LWAGFIAVGAVVPVDHVPGGGWFDKVVHLCEYALLAWLMMTAARSNGATLPSAFVWSSALSILYGGMLELVQLMLPYRKGDWQDFGVNAIGTLLGIGLRLPRWTRRT